MPRARSKEMAPVGMASTATAAPFWPSFMIEPLPNCFSIWDRAASMALAAGALLLVGVFVFHGTSWVGRGRFP